MPRGPGRSMRIRDRYRRLSLWNRLAFWGSIASLAGLVLAIVSLRPSDREAERLEVLRRATVEAELLKLALTTNFSPSAGENIRFLVDAGLLADSTGKLRALAVALRNGSQAPSPGAVGVRLAVNGANHRVHIRWGEPYVLQWSSTNATACQLRDPDASGISLSGSTASIEPGHPWYPERLHTVKVISVECTGAAGNAADLVLVET